MHTQAKDPNGQNLSWFPLHEACLGVLLLPPPHPPPGRDASPSPGYPLVVLYMNVTGTHLYTWVKRDKSSLLKEPARQVRLEPRTYRSEFEVLMT